MADNNGEMGAFLTGFVVGGLVGAAVSLLLAPQSGEETRTLIRDKGIELRDQADNEIKRFRETADKTLQEVQSQADEMQKRGQEMIEEARARVSSAVEQGVEAARQIRSQAEDKSAEDSGATA
jgi:gas vesicle protein